jgi:hypothetical protein
VVVTLGWRNEDWSRSYDTVRGEETIFAYRGRTGYIDAAEQVDRR